jgi:Sigma-70 region 2
VSHRKKSATFWHPARLLLVKSSTGREIQIIQSSMHSPGGEMRRASPQMQEPVNGKKELDTERTTGLFHRHAPSLFAYFRQHTASREDAEDLLHEVFAAALQRPEFGLLSDAENCLTFRQETHCKQLYFRKDPATLLAYLEAQRLQSPCGLPEPSCGLGRILLYWLKHGTAETPAVGRSRKYAPIYFTGFSLHTRLFRP